MDKSARCNVETGGRMMRLIEGERKGGERTERDLQREGRGNF